MKNSAEDVFFYLSSISGTSSELTFTCNQLDGETTINGTLKSGSSYTFRNFYHSTTNLPSLLVPGHTYQLMIDAPDNRVSIQITYYDSTGASIGGTGLRYTLSKLIRIPDNTVGINIRMYVDGSTGIDRVYSNYTIKYHMIPSFQFQLIESSVDFDQLVENNVTYCIIGEYNHTNKPDGFRFGYVEVYVTDYSQRSAASTASSHRWMILQKAYSISRENSVYAIRHKVLNQEWSSWYYLETSDPSDVKPTVEHNVDIVQSGNDTYNYLVRSEFNNIYDAVYAVGVPSRVYNNVLCFGGLRLIPKETSLENTSAVYNSTSNYKSMGDEIPALEINGDFVGSNHGNPNYTRVDCVHSLDQSYIGSIWTDESNNEYTLVNVYTDYLIFGSLDSNGYLVVRSPENLYRGSIILTSSSTKSYQLRRSAINKQYSIVNNFGEHIYSSGGGNNVIVTEEYDICDQSKGLQYLQGKVGTCTNESYYDDNQPYLLGHVSNVFIFNRNSSITVYGSFVAKTTLTCNRVFGTMSANFSSGNHGSDSLYVPDSGNCVSIKSYVGDEDNFNVSLDPSSEIMHHRYYQLSDNGHAHFLHLLNMGCYDNTLRKSITKAAYNAADANKFYCNLTKSKVMNAGDSLSWGYGRGPYLYTSNQTVLCYFEYNEGWIVAMDWHQSFDGVVDLPYYLSGKSIQQLQHTDSVNISDTVVTNVGIHASCSDYGYAVLYVK